MVHINQVEREAAQRLGMLGLSHNRTDLYSKKSVLLYEQHFYPVIDSV
jgi:hypothetical protein